MKFSLLLIVGTLCGTFSSFGEEIRLDQPVAASLSPDIIYYPFDEPQSATITNHAQQVDAPAPWYATKLAGESSHPINVEGKPGFGHAIRLNGETKASPRDRNPCLQIAGSGHLNFDALTAFTLGLWLRIDPDMEFSDKQRIVLFDKGGAGYRGGGAGGVSFYLECLSAGNGGANWQVLLELRSESKSELFRVGPVLLTSDEWHHLAFSWDDSEKRVTFWMDGKSIESRLVGENVSIGATDRGALIGERQTSGYWSRFKGEIDDFFITTGIHSFQPINSNPHTAQ